MNTVDKISAFFKQHGVAEDEFQKAFSSFAVESKLQRADFLNRRYRVQSVPLMIVNGNADRLKRHIAMDDRARRALEAIEIAVKRGTFR